MKNVKYFMLGAAAAAILSIGVGVSGVKAAEITKDLKTADGTVIGTVNLKDTAQGVLLTIDAKGMNAGSTHAIHVHETGKCAPDFKAAGGHFNPADHAHGMMSEEGQHAGDMPNLHANENGMVKQEILNTMITLEPEDTDNGRHSIYDADGSALIIHEGADDYASQPTGEAGGRLACAVLAEPKE